MCFSILMLLQCPSPFDSYFHVYKFSKFTNILFQAVTKPLPNLEVPTIYKAYFSGLNFRGYTPKIWPTIWCVYVPPFQDPESFPLNSQDIIVHHRTKFAQPILLFRRSMLAFSSVFHRRGTPRPASDVTKNKGCGWCEEFFSHMDHQLVYYGLFIYDLY